MDEIPPPENHHRPAAADSARQRHAARPAAPSPPGSVFVYAWLLAAAAVTVFLAAGPVQGSLGIFLVGAGLALTFLPARVRVEWPLWVAVGGLLVCGALAFLPARWFRVPAWRATLATAPSIHLPSTVTPMPWETGFWLAILGLSCLTGLFLLAHPVRSRAVLWLAASAVAVCGLYAALAIYAHQTGWHYPFTGGASFGFFPNRNHTATFLVTGSIMAMGVITVGLRENRWILSALVAACLSVCVTGLFFYSASRGGILFLLAGTVIWAIGLGRVHRSLPLNVTLGALAVAASLLFLLSGGEARARLLGGNDPVGSAQTASVDSRQAGSPEASATSDRETTFGFRTLIYQDTLDLIKDAPLTGVGLGSFAPVFAQYRRASWSEAATLHPESDWLMLVAETGVPTIFFGLSLIGLILARLRGEHLHPSWPVRWACVSAALAAAAHGIVDVPAHRVALGWWIVFLAALGAHAGSRRRGESGWPQRILFIFGGLAALALGVQLIRAEWFGGRALPPFAAARAMEDVLAVAKRGDEWAAMEKAREAVEIFPLNAPLYHELGLLQLHFEDSDHEVDEAFQAERVLNPNWPGVPLHQGDAWSLIDSKRAVTLWREAVDRQRRAGDVPRAAAYYGAVLWRAREWPVVQQELRSEIDNGPDFLFAWLEGAAPEVVRDHWPALNTRDALLGSLNAGQREKFLLLWRARGDRDNLTRFLAENPAWEEFSWPLRLRESIDAHQFEQAVHVTAEHYGISLALPSQPEPGSGANLGDDRIEKFKAEWSTGNTASARLTLNGAEGVPSSSVAATEYWRLKTALAAYDQEWPQAWECLKRSLQLSHPTAALP